MNAERLRQVLARKQMLPATGRTSSGGSGTSIVELYDAAALAVLVNGKLSHYMNHGYWYNGTSSIQESGDNLMERIVAGIRVRSACADLSNQRVLDVACGLGATTRYLANKWKPENVTGINITETQLQACRRIAPQCRFEKMFATSLAFPAEAFDHIVCVEAAFQFETRADFLKEALRVLKPGGVLALTDVLLVPEAYQEMHRFASHHPKANYCFSLENYRTRTLEAGYRQCDVADITREGFKSHFRFFVSSLHEDWLAGRLSFDGLQRHLESLYLQDSTMNAELICFATK